MDFKLSESELKELQHYQRQHRMLYRRYVKATVLIMLHHKVAVTEICQFLGIDDNTVYRYAKSYKEVGLRKYFKDNFHPYEGKLADDQLSKLATHLSENCYSSAAGICQWIANEFEIDYTPPGLVALLHRLGFAYKKTKVIPSKADEVEQVAFLEEKLPEMLEEVQSGEAEVYFADGCHPTHNTRSSYGWIKKGEDFEVLANSGRKRVNINGALNATKPTHLVYDIADRLDAQSTKRLCQKLLRKHRKKRIYFICDNARYNHNKELKKWAENTRIELVYLPSYSPNLNLIERLWGFLKQRIINSTYFEKYDDFKKAIIDFLQNPKPYKEDLKSLMALNFRTIGGTSVYSQFT